MQKRSREKGISSLSGLCTLRWRVVSILVSVCLGIGVVLWVSHQILLLFCQKYDIGCSVHSHAVGVHDRGLHVFGNASTLNQDARVSKTPLRKRSKLGLHEDAVLEGTIEPRVLTVEHDSLRLNLSSAGSRVKPEGSIVPGTNSTSPVSHDPSSAELTQAMNRSLAAAVANVSKGKAVIVVSANSGYLHFVRNWYMSVERLGYGKNVLFIAEEAEAFVALEREHPGQVVLLAQDTVEASAQSFLSDGYFKIVDRRPQYLEALLKLQVSFLYNDVDIVWLRDPFPYFRGKYDAWVTSDYFLDLGEITNSPTDDPLPASRHSVCTCFMYFTPTRGSHQLVRKWQKVLHEHMSKSGAFVKNQPAFNRAIIRTPLAKVAVLPQRLFPSGSLVFRNVTWRREMKARGVKPVVVHNNWGTGYKKKLWRFKTQKLWFLDGSESGTVDELQRELELDSEDLAVADAATTGELSF